MNEIEYNYDKDGELLEEEVEYYYDENGEILEIDGVKQEVSCSMKDAPMSIRILSCPICRACKHQFFNEQTYEIKCSVLGIIPEDIDEGNVYKCTEYLANKESYDYDLVTKLIETQKPIE